MIGFLAGVVIASHNGVNTVRTSLNCESVGYEVHVNESDGVGGTCELWIHEHAPQDAPHELYGFREREQRDLFRRLLDIKGVGPKVAMNILASYTVSSLKSMGDAGQNSVVPNLTSIRGVGRTLADRIVEALR